MSSDPNSPAPLPIPPLPPPGAMPPIPAPLPPPMRAMPPYPPSMMGYERIDRPCPACGGPRFEPGFTWWGGLIGHKILGVEQCKSCKKWWVKETGQPGGTRVTIYMVVGIILGLAIAAAWIFAQTQ